LKIRVHAFFPLLAVVCLVLSSSDGVARGWACFWCLRPAVLVRETARLLVLHGWDSKLRAVLLLPIGGLFAYADPESRRTQTVGAGQFEMAFAGRRRQNAATALVLAFCVSGASGDVQLFQSAVHQSAWLLRSLFGCRLASLCCICCRHYPLDCGRLIRGSFARKHGFVQLAAPPRDWVRC